MIETLRAMPLFEALSDEQLRWLVERGSELSLPAGTLVFTEGTPADAFYVLVEGAMHLSKRVAGHETDFVTADTPGVWGGFLPVLGETYAVTLRVPRDSRLFRIPADAVTHMLTAGFPIATHLLAGVFAGGQNLQALVRQQEKLSALGRLSAGLAHELNNPASAARRAAALLREAVERQQDAALALAPHWPEAREQLAALRQEVLERFAAAPRLTPLERSDREEAVGAWLAARAVPRPWELAQSLVEANLDEAWLEALAARLPPAVLADVACWLAWAGTACRLTDEVERSATRISELVRAIKEYSYMDQAPMQEVDLHAGLDNTLIILGHKLKRGVAVTREYAADLPRICAHGSELNQVWTNLVDNAVDAMHGEGELRIRTARDGAGVLVEIADNGPGIPPEIQPHIFEPFFTTKDVGAGTGLGLDIAYRIVVRQHQGNLQFETGSDGTRFQAWLPITPPHKTGGSG